MHNLQRGISLVEMVVVMAIFAILTGLAVPSFNAWLANVQIRTATESIQNGLQLARAEAIRRNSPVMFWLTSGTNPLTGDWLVGCANPVSSNNFNLPEAPGDCPGIARTAALPASGPPFFWIQRTTAAAQQTSLPQVTAIGATGANTTAVTFNSLGMVIATNTDDGSAAIAQIDVNQPSLPVAVVRPLRVMIAGGQIRMCDPNLSLASDPRGCN